MLEVSQQCSEMWAWKAPTLPGWDSAVLLQLQRCWLGGPGCTEDAAEGCPLCQDHRLWYCPFLDFGLRGRWRYSARGPLSRREASQKNLLWRSGVLIKDVKETSASEDLLSEKGLKHPQRVSGWEWWCRWMAAMVCSHWNEWWRVRRKYRVAAARDLKGQTANWSITDLFA